MFRECNLQNDQWRSHPLCASYLVLRLEALHLVAQEAGEASPVSAWWALGTLHDGQTEAAGVWLVPTAAEVPLERIFADLSTRGVEHIGFLIGTSGAASVDDEHPAAGPRHLAASCPRSALSSAAAECSPRHRRFVRATEARAEQIQRRLLRAVRRHGCFSGHDEIIAVLGAALHRAERDICVPVDDRAVNPLLH